MNERLTILNALKQEPKDIIKELELDLPGLDVVEKWAKRKKKEQSFKYKNCDEWNNTDFLNYLDSMLKEFGVCRLKGNLRKDANTLNRLYDALAKPLQTQMNNSVLKDYLDWWCSIWAPRLNGGEFYLEAIIRDYQVARFVTRHEEAKEIEDANRSSETASTEQLEASNNDIYNFGGLTLLLMERGIVSAYQILMKQHTVDPEAKIGFELNKFSEDILISVVNLTCNCSPYSSEYEIDFISLVSPYLQKFGVTAFLNLNHTQYFRSK